MSCLADIFLAVAVVCVAIYWWLKYHYSYWQRKGIPYMKPVPILGNTKVMFTLSNSFGLHLSDIYNDKRMQGEPVIGVYIFHKPGLIVRNPELLKSILIRDFNKFPNHYGNCDPHGDKLGANNLFFVKNQKWKAIRTKLTPVFTSGKVKQMYPLMQEIGEDLEDHLANYVKESNAFIADIKEICANFTTDLIATIAYGLKIKSLKDPNTEFRIEARKIFDFDLVRAFHFFIVFFLPKLVTLFRAKIFTESFSKLIRKNIGFVMDERERSGVARNDLIDILLALRKEALLEDGDHFAKDNDFLVAQAAVFTTAGFETSSSTMTFALYELSKRPEMQERLRQEIHEAFVEENGIISYEKLQSLEYLGMIIDETLRLYPVLPFLDRECVLKQGEKPFSLKPFCDYEIPNGMPVFIPIFGIHRDANYWSNPNEFDPERFSPENKKNLKPMSYMPFGIGPRNCIGSRIGLLQTRIGLVRILKNHYVTTCDRTIKEMKFDPKALLLACNDGIHLKLVYDGLYEKSRK